MSRASPPRSIGKGGLGTSTAMFLKPGALRPSLYTTAKQCTHPYAQQGNRYQVPNSSSTTNNNISNKASAEATVATKQYFGGLHVKILQMYHHRPQTLASSAHDNFLLQFWARGASAGPGLTALTTLWASLSRL